jgi:GT2 family glycosyltransferase
MLMDPACFEVIVVDNDSRDGSVEMMKSDFPWVRVEASPVNLGFAAGSQLGYELSSGEFVLLLNPDTVVVDHAIDTLVERLAATPDAAIIGSRLLNSDGSFQRASGGAFPSLANVAWNYLFLNRVLPARWGPEEMFIKGDPQGIRDIDWVSGASLLFRRAAVGERIFDPAFFMFGEDMDVCDRMKRQGWRVLYSTEQSIIHHHGSSFAKQAEQQVLATVYKGPRTFFARTHGPFALAVYDLLLVVGYGTRWLGALLLQLCTRRQNYADQARFSGDFVRTMLRARASHKPRARLQRGTPAANHVGGGEASA